MWTLILYTRPKEGRSLLGLNREAKLSKASTAARWNVIEVHVHGKDANTRLTLFLMRNIIMMCLVELANFVPQHLLLERDERDSVCGR